MEPISTYPWMRVRATSRLLGFTQIQAEPVKWPAASVGMPASTVPRQTPWEAAATTLPMPNIRFQGRLLTAFSRNSKATARRISPRIIR